MLSTEDRREKRLQAPACFGAVKAVSCPLLCFFFPPQVDEIYHDESLGVHINIVLVRMIMVGYRQVRTVPVLTSVRSRDEREPFSGWFLEPEALGGHLC